MMRTEVNLNSHLIGSIFALSMCSHGGEDGSILKWAGYIKRAIFKKKNFKFHSLCSLNNSSIYKDPSYLTDKFE